jgi:molybdopterin molybdotransferase
MDGFAVRAIDVRGATAQNPVKLRVVGDISAGKVLDIPVGKKQALRIMTGGVLPEGADSVVPVEYTDNPNALVDTKLEAFVEVHKEVSEGEFIRLSGQDVHKGTRVLSSGHRLRPQDIGILAALGISKISVYRRPQVAVISTGDELVDIGEALSSGRIFDSNGYALEAAVKSAGAIPLRMGIVPDDAIKLNEAFTRCVQIGADLIISSAGVSMGAYDFVRTVVEKHGHLEFWKVNIRPGKPILMGSYRGIPIMGLPGNPVSALVTFEIFVKPLINQMAGEKSIDRIKFLAKLLHPIISDGRESFLRARVTQVEKSFEVQLVGSQDSGVLSSLVEANALIRIPAGKKNTSRGELVEVWILRQDGSL